jgi:hypothetical protein
VADPVLPPCAHRGEPTGETAPCGTCKGTVRLKLFPCAVYGSCTVGKKLPGRGCCRKCPKREAPPATAAAGCTFSFP